MTTSQVEKTEEGDEFKTEFCEVTTQIVSMTSEQLGKYRFDCVEVRPYDDKTVLLVATDALGMALVREDGFTRGRRYVPRRAIGVSEGCGRRVEFIGHSMDVTVMDPTGDNLADSFAVLEPRFSIDEVFPKVETAIKADIDLSKYTAIHLGIDLIRRILRAIQPAEGGPYASDDVTLFIDPATCGDDPSFLFCCGGLGVIMPKECKEPDSTVMSAQAILNSVLPVKAEAANA